MKNRIKTLLRVPQEYRLHLGVYLVGGLWGAVFGVFQPAAVGALFETWTGYLVAVAAVAGAVIAIEGVLTKSNLLVERVGVLLLTSAPVAYGLLQLGLIIFEISSVGFSGRIHLLFLVLWLVLTLTNRLSTLTRKVREAKSTPLTEEHF